MIEALHGEVLAASGGLAGLRDAGLLESAVARPQHLVAYGGDPSLFDLAASLCVGLVQNHPFVDGNKRTALLAARAFLFLNDVVFEPEQAEEVAMLVGVAERRVTEGELSGWFHRKSGKGTDG